MAKTRARSRPRVTRSSAAAATAVAEEEEEEEESNAHDGGESTRNVLVRLEQHMAAQNEVLHAIAAQLSALKSERPSADADSVASRVANLSEGSERRVHKRSPSSWDMDDQGPRPRS